MAWLDKSKTGNWYLKDRINGKEIVVVKSLGIHKGYAEDAKTAYKKAVAQGFIFEPPVLLSAVETFLQAKREGRDFGINARRLPMEEMCDLYLQLFGPSLKGGVSARHNSSYRDLWYLMGMVKRFWAGKYADEIGKLEMRDFISQFKTVGTRMRRLGRLSHMFTFFAELNEEESQKLGGPIRLPASNPATKLRKMMKSHEKRELPDTRVLTHEEWARFIRHLTERPKAICEVALRRLLRLSDIKHITHASIADGYIKGLQQKTGEEFRVPVLTDQRQAYDFTNFKREFASAQKKAGLFFPASHPLHFSAKDLRRTGATWLYEKTKDIRGIQKMLGHRSLRTTERYLNISDSDLTNLAKTIDTMADTKLKIGGAAGGTGGALAEQLPKPEEK